VQILSHNSITSSHEGVASQNIMKQKKENAVISLMMNDIVGIIWARSRAARASSKEILRSSAYGLNRLLGPRSMLPSKILHLRNLYFVPEYPQMKQAILSFTFLNAVITMVYYLEFQLPPDTENSANLHLRSVTSQQKSPIK